MDQIAGSIGSDTVVSSTNSGHGALWIIAGVSVCILGGLLAIGQGWARYILVCLGAASIVSLALAASWLALPAMAVLVLASVLVLAPRTHRYLQ